MTQVVLKQGQGTGQRVAPALTDEDPSAFHLTPRLQHGGLLERVVLSYPRTHPAYATRSTPIQMLNIVRS